MCDVASVGVNTSLIDCIPATMLVLTLSGHAETNKPNILGNLRRKINEKLIQSHSNVTTNDETIKTSLSAHTSTSGLDV